MPTNQPDLELIDTKILIDELSKRFDGMVFCGIRDTSPATWATGTRLEGNAITCLAAAAYLQARVAEKVAAERIK